MPLIVNSPWGRVQHSRQVCPGVIEVSTASHGGLHLSAERWSKLSDTFPTFKPYAGQPWLEEDCDCVLATLLWPDECAAYGDFSIYTACRIARAHRDSWPSVLEWLDSQAGEHIRIRVGQFMRDHSQDWMVSSWGTDGTNSHAVFRRIGDNKTVGIDLRNGQELDKPLFTDVDLATMWAG